MQTEARRQLAEERPAPAQVEEHPPLAPLLLQLPELALRLAVAQLEVTDRCNLRLACRATEALISASTTQLSLGWQDICSGGPLLPQRFSCVTQLTLSGGSISSDSGSASGSDNDSGRRSDSNGPPSSDAKQWPSVTSIVCKADGTVAEAALQLCPNVESFRMPAFCSPSLLQQLARLPRLSQLQLPYYSVYSAQVQALASCSTLAELTVKVDEDCSDSAWAQLLGMTSLTSLHLEHNWWETYAPLDFSRLSNLQRLVLPRPYEDQDHPQDDEEFDEERFEALMLPASVLSLNVPHAAMAALAATPHLTSLTTEQTMKEQQLAALARSCTGLVSLSVQYLSVTAACHKAPLLVLTELSVTGVFASAKGVHLAKAAPALQALSLRWEGALHKGIPPPFGGLKALARLDLGVDGPPGDDRIIGPELRECDFAALAKLPALRHLRLVAHPSHFEELGQLGQLTSLELVWQNEWTSEYTDEATALEDHMDVLGNWQPPEQLTSMALVFGLRFDDVKMEDDVAEAFGSFRDALIAWAARAPMLESVRWRASVSQSKEVAMTPAMLHALVAARPTIRHITVAPDPLMDPDHIVWPAAMQQAVEELAGSGAQVVLASNT